MQTPTRSVAVQNASFGAAYTPGDTTVTGAPGSSKTVAVLVQNTGTLTWQPGSVNLSYHLLAPSGATYVWDGARTALAAPIAPGGSAVVNLRIQLPVTPATYQVRIDLVQEGVSWFSERGVPTASLTLIVQ